MASRPSTILHPAEVRGVKAVARDSSVSLVDACSRDMKLFDMQNLTTLTSHILRERETDRHRQTDRQTDRQTHTHTHTHTHTQGTNTGEIDM